MSNTSMPVIPCYIFLTQAQAQSASTFIWNAIGGVTYDLNAATGEDQGDITKAWAVPQQRLIDLKWWIPVCASVPNSQNWTIEYWSQTWMAPTVPL